MYKPSLSFYTNIPTPYQLSFFDELSKRFELKVIYFSKSENNRTWDFDFGKCGYEIRFLKNNFISKIVQGKFVDFDLKMVLNMSKHGSLYNQYPLTIKLHGRRISIKKLTTKTNGDKHEKI